MRCVKYCCYFSSAVTSNPGGGGGGSFQRGDCCSHPDPSLIHPRLFCVCMHCRLYFFSFPGFLWRPACLSPRLRLPLRGSSRLLISCHIISPDVALLLLAQVMTHVVSKGLKSAERAWLVLSAARDPACHVSAATCGRRVKYICKLPMSRLERCWRRAIRCRSSSTPRSHDQYTSLCTADHEATTALLLLCAVGVVVVVGPEVEL